MTSYGIEQSVTGFMILSSRIFYLNFLSCHILANCHINRDSMRHWSFLLLLHTKALLNLIRYKVLQGIDMFCGTDEARTVLPPRQTRLMRNRNWRIQPRIAESSQTLAFYQSLWATQSLQLPIHNVSASQNAIRQVHIFDLYNTTTSASAAKSLFTRSRPYDTPRLSFDLWISWIWSEFSM
jgi:hypothetical protein